MGIGYVNNICVLTKSKHIRGYVVSAKKPVQLMDTRLRGYDTIVEQVLERGRIKQPFEIIFGR